MSFLASIHRAKVMVPLNTIDGREEKDEDTILQKQAAHLQWELVHTKLPLSILSFLKCLYLLTVSMLRFCQKY